MDTYLANKETVDSKAKQYEHGNEEILEQAMQDAEFADYEAYDELAPGTHQTERDDAAEGQMDSEAHSFYGPVKKVHAYSDIGLDLGLQGNMSQVEQHAIRLPDKEYRELIQKLNTKQ